jgi:hypothetical protein
LPPFTSSRLLAFSRPMLVITKKTTALLNPKPLEV